LALAQHEAYCSALEQCGLTLTRLEPDPTQPDSTFVEDTAVITTQCAVIMRPGAPSRAGEIPSIKDVLAEFYPSALSVQPPGTIDGGDVCEAGEHFFIGISRRTNEAGARQLAEMLASFGYTTSFVDILRSGRGVPSMTHAQDARATHDILHLKSGIAYLGDNRLVVIDELANRSELSNYDLVRVSDDEMYAANCLRVNDHVLLAAGYPVLDGKLRELGYQTIVLDVTEFQKMDGGLSCLSLRF
jgi:dimethylargininase